jgi:phosphoglycerate kinase
VRAVGIRDIPSDQMGLDIGPATVGRFGEALAKARTIVWNGPMGVFEREPFAAGTMGVARAVTAGGAFSVIGGGDTIAAAQAAGVTDKVGYISTAGGAFLEFLEGRDLPGVVALDDAPGSRP